MRRTSVYWQAFCAAALLVTEAASVVLLLHILGGSAPVSRAFFAAAGIILYLLADVQLMKAAKELAEKRAVEEKEACLRYSLELEKRRSVEIENDLLHIGRIKEDLRMRILEAKELAGRKKNAEAGNTVIQAEIFDMPKKIYCTNPVADAVISAKKQECDGSGTELRTSLEFPEEEVLTSAQLCAVFSNLLDNALHACAELEQSRRTVILKSSLVNDHWVICCENPFHRTETRKKKTDPGMRLHGWGLEIIEDIVAGHGGTVRITCQDGNFRVEIFLQLSDRDSSSSFE